MISSLEYNLKKFKEQEIKKTQKFFFTVAPIFNNYFNDEKYQLIDLCSGKGLCSLLFHYNKLVSQTFLIDKRISQKFINITKNIFKKENFLYHFFKKDIFDFDFNLNNFKDKNASVVAIHPCSRLADKIIQLSIDAKLPFALMTCCHKKEPPQYNLKNPPDPRLMMYEEKEDYADLIRKKYIEEQNWKCYWKEVPKSITKKNHVLIGIPSR